MTQPKVSPGVLMATLGALFLIAATFIGAGFTAGLIATGVSFLVGAFIYALARIQIDLADDAR